MFSTVIVRKPIIFLCTVVLFGGMFVSPAQAALTTLTSQTSSSTYFQLVAKVEYLKAFIEALRDGEQSPAPTATVVLYGDIVSLIGTLAHDPNPERVEPCGPMSKGQVDWGDGVVETIHGLGCSGEVHTFTLHHRYDTSGSHKIIITDSLDRSYTHVVAVQVTDNDDAPVVNLTQEGAEVTAKGKAILDDRLPTSCDETLIATVVWGDGTTEPVLTTCPKTTFSFSHTYAATGVYKMYVRDRDGDMTQSLITVE